MRISVRPALRAATALAVLMFVNVALGQLRVATWNISNYGGGQTADVQNAVYGVFNSRSMSPDIIVTQEFTSAAAVNSFRTALNTAAGSPGDWASANFVDGPDTDSAFFYRTSRVSLLATNVVSVGGGSPNQPRNIMRYDVRLVGYTADGATLACYSSHMKAGTTPDDLDRREVEAVKIRNNAETLPANWQFMVLGDFNIQSSSESSYVELTGSQANNAGRSFDPINTPGDWNNANAYRFVHSQDPASGMDDRFDFILIESGLRDGLGFEYIGNSAIAFSNSTWNDPNHSFRSWGNDGTSYNQTLRTTGNTMVGPSIAQSLINLASGLGHLPLYLDLRVPPEVSSETVLDFGQVPQNSVAELTLNVSNDGNTALWSAAGIANLTYTLSASSGFAAPGGSFADAAGGGGNAHVVSMNTSSPGVKNGTITISSNSVDQPVRVVTVTGEVGVAGNPDIGDLNCDGFVDFFDIDPFLMALFNPAMYGVIWFDCDINNADVNEDNAIDFFDIDAFLDVLFG